MKQEETIHSAEFIMVPVPRERVLEVYQLLAASRISSAGGDATAIEGDWSDELIARAYRESPEKMKRFLDFLAGADGKVITSEELALAVGYTRRQLAGMLGAFGNRVKQRYQKDTWFFEADWDVQKRLFVYAMGDHQAGVIERSGR